MDRRLLEGIKSCMPTINPRIANGIAMEQLPGAEVYIDKVLRAADFPEELIYEGYRSVLPPEEFKVVSDARDNKLIYELARSDFYMVAYKFSLKDQHGNVTELFPRHIQLPVVDIAGMLHINGKRFAIHPVLADPAFSVTSNSMFIQLTRTRVTFERIPHHFMANGKRESTYVAWSWLYTPARQKHGRKSSNARIVYSTMANYLFARFGVTETFKRYAHADVVIGEASEITEDKYPADKWHICTTVGNRPKASRKDDYRPTRLRVAVPIDQYTPTVKSLLGGLFYMADNFTDMVTAQEIDEVDFWKVILGLVILDPDMGRGLMVREIEEHQQSLDEYVDKIVFDELKASGVHCEDIYDIFMYVVDRLSQTTATTDEGMSNIYGKRLITLRYVVRDLVYNINRMMYELRAIKKKRGTLPEKDVNTLMGKWLRHTSLRIKLSHHAEHPEVTTVSASNDNYLIAITSEILTQDKASGSGRGGKSKINLKDPAKHLHVSVAEVASYNVLPKSDPTGRNRINPFVQIGEGNMVMRDKSLVDLLDSTQVLLNR